MKDIATTIGSVGPLPAPGDGGRPALAGFWRKLLAFGGPGYLVAVGYMDPGNWATDLAGGSAFGYALLSVVLLSSMMAMLLQYLSAKLGIATGRDLAQLCREHFSPRVAIALWALCELAIIACDLAELLGTAIALQLLFGVSARLGRRHRGGRHLADPGPAAGSGAQPRNLHHRIAAGDRRLLRGRAHLRAAGAERGPGRPRPADAHRHRSRPCSMSRSASSARP